MFRVLGLGLLLVVSGCAAKITPEGTLTRIVESNDECVFLGVVTSSNAMGWHTSHDAEGAMNEARNKVAALGGNSLKIINVDSDMAATTMVVEALNCKR